MDKQTQSENFRSVVADTPEVMLQAQHDFWMKNSPERRLEMTLLFIESCRQLNKAGMKNHHSDWSDAKIIVEQFKLSYKDFFSEEEMNSIIEVLRRFNNI